MLRSADRAAWHGLPWASLEVWSGEPFIRSHVHSFSIDVWGPIGAKPRLWGASGEETDQVAVPMKGVLWWEKRNLNT